MNVKHKKKIRKRMLPLLNRFKTAGKKPFLRALGVVLLVSAGLAALGFGLHLVRQSVAELPEYRVRSADLRLIQGPRWMTPEIAAGLDITADLPEEFSLLDEQIAGRIVAAYARKVWVKRVLRVAKHYPQPGSEAAPIEVHLEFRSPVAFVAIGDRYYLVDSEGIRLPGVYSGPRLGDAEFFVISGARGRVPLPGQKWQSPEIVAGVRVASSLASRRYAFNLARIDVSNIGGRRDPGVSEIAIYTHRLTRIDWGKPPGPRTDILEKPLLKKIAYLDYVYEKFGGRIDGQLIYVDVPNESIRRRPSLPAY